MAMKKHKVERGALSSPRELKKVIDLVLRLGRLAGAQETEVQLDETIDALTRFANNAIHRRVDDERVTGAVRADVVRGTARAQADRVDEDALGRAGAA